MIIVILILSVFMMFLFMGHSKTRPMLIYLLASASLIVIALSMLLYLVRIWNYTGIFEFEYNLYRYINRLSAMYYYTIINVISVSIGLYMASMWAAGWFFIKRTYDFKTGFKCAVSLLPAILHIVTNLQFFTLRLHLWLCERPYLSKSAAIWFNTQNILIMLFYVIFPFAEIYRYNKRTKIVYRKKVNNIFAATILMTSVFFLFYYKMAMFDFKIIDFGNLMRYSASFTGGFSGGFYITAILMTFFAAGATYYLFIKYHVFYDMIAVYQRRNLKNLTVSLNDARPMLHSCKNNFLSSGFMIRDIIDDVEKNKLDTEELISRLHEIDRHMTDSMNDIGAVLNVAKNKSISYESVDLYDCINAAESMVFADGIRIENSVERGEYIVLGDRREITHVIKNILCNAAEALSGQSRGKIQISGYIDKGWIYIFVHDNGCGIERRDLKKVFMPLFSTKKTKTNWGIGLSYVNNMMRTHHGMVFIDSKPGEYTEVQLQFPRIRERGIQDR